MRWLKSILVMMGILLFIACAERKNDKVKYVYPDFEKKEFLNKDSSDNLLNISRFDFDGEGNLYLFDRNHFTINKYDSYGRMITQRGKRGPGPGEFEENETYFLKWGASHLIVYNLNKHQLQFYNTDLELIKTKYFEEPFFDFDYHTEGASIYSFVDHKPEKALSYYPGFFFKRKKVGFELSLDETNLYYNILLLEFIDKQHFIGAYLYRNQMAIIKLNGEVHKQFSAPSLPALSEVSESYVPDNIMIQDITIANNGQIWMLAGGYAKYRRRDIYVFDKNGNYLHTFTLPLETAQIIYRDDYLYTMNKDRSDVIQWTILRK